MNRWEQGARRVADAWASVLALGLAGAPALAQRPTAPAAVVDPQQKAIERGAKLVGFCANCHGANGNSSAPEIPNLAGQNAAYLQEQMRRFVDGRRKDVFMQGLIKAMSETERADAVAYLSSQAMQPHAAGTATPAQLAQGKAYYGKVCFRCHGATAMGEGVIPRLAGQQPGYVLKSLHRYRDGTGERLEPQMAANTRMMSDEEIAAVAAYVGSLR